MSRKTIRAIAASLICIPLAGGLLLQSLSGVLTRLNPDLAVSLWPMNGLALEQGSFQRFAEIANRSGSKSKAATSLEQSAIATLRQEPLAPKAYTIVALAEKGAHQKTRILDAAYKINRRDLALLGLVLEQHVVAQDYSASVKVLDQLLRVHPEYETQFFPVLLAALQQPSTVELFADLLNGSVGWHERFLLYAVNQPSALGNLATLREQLAFVPSELDAKLIAGLVADGQISLARRRVPHNCSRLVAPSRKCTLDWKTEFAPLDWKLMDDAGLRGEISADQSQLGINVRPGKGGPIAQRVISTPNTPFSIRFAELDLPAYQLKDVGIELTCFGKDAPFYNERLSRVEDATFRISSLPPNCDDMTVSISARSWSGGSALNGSLGRLIIAPL